MFDAVGSELMPTSVTSTDFEKRCLTLVGSIKDVCKAVNKRRLTNEYIQIYFRGRHKLLNKHSQMCLHACLSMGDRVRVVDESESFSR